MEERLVEEAKVSKDGEGGDLNIIMILGLMLYFISQIRRFWRVLRLCKRIRYAIIDLLIELSVS